jgi:hypothetical protein
MFFKNIFFSLHLVATSILATFLLGSSLAATTVTPQEIFIIVPGTWSAQSTWHLPGGTFFESLKESAAKIGAEVVTFPWSGENSHNARIKAAKKLAHVIEQYDRVHLVTHSHGSNVGILASQLLAQCNTGKKITFFYALATPVLQDEYVPQMDVINYFFNFFSLADKVQTAFGVFQRTFQPHDRIINLRVTIDGHAPTHSSIHDPLIAHHLPFFLSTVAEQADFLKNPGIVHFVKEAEPLCATDQDQETLVALERDLFTLDMGFRKEKEKKS